MTNAVRAIVFASLWATFARSARAETAVTPMAPSFPVGPYTALYVDPADPRRVAVGTAAGVVAWSEDAGESATEAQALSARRYDASALRGTSTLGLLGRPSPEAEVPLGAPGRGAATGNRHPQLSPLRPSQSQRAIRLFLQSMRDGSRFARWSFWMAVGAPFTDVSAIAMPAGRGRMLAASSAGIILSDSERGAWTRTLGGPGAMARERDLAAMSVTIDPQDPTRVLAGTTQGIYVSDDGGFTFAPHPTTALAEETVFAFQWDPGSPGTLLAIGDRVILRSDDAGRSFEPAFVSPSAIFGVAMAADAAFVATSDGLQIVSDGGERRILSGQSVVGVVAWGGGVLVATQTELLELSADGGRHLLVRTSGDDPFLALRGGPGLAWAITGLGIYRVGGDPIMRGRQSRAAPRLLLRLPEVELAVRERLGLIDPADVRFHPRWYAKLIPSVVAEVVGSDVVPESLTYDGTFPIRFRNATARRDRNIDFSVFAVWDFSSILFGDNNVVNPNLIIESGVRDTRERILGDVRMHYREVSILVRMLERPPSSLTQRLAWRLRLEEHAAYLEAVSGRQVVEGEEL